MLYVVGTGSGESQCNDDLACLTMASMDRHGLDAIRSLHRQLDDDANGAVDLSESDEVSMSINFGGIVYKKILLLLLTVLSKL